MLVLKIRLENIYIRLISKISKDNDLTLFFTIKDVSFYIISLQITQPGVVPMDVKRAPQARDWMVPAVLFLADGDMCNHGCQQCKYQTVLGVLLIVHHSNKYSKY